VTHVFKVDVGIAGHIDDFRNAPPTAFTSTSLAEQTPAPRDVKYLALPAAFIDL
jgi:hypothetical protein